MAVEARSIYQLIHKNASGFYALEIFLCFKFYSYVYALTCIRSKAYEWIKTYTYEYGKLQLQFMCIDRIKLS